MAIKVTGPNRLVCPRALNNRANGSKESGGNGSAVPETEDCDRLLREAVPARHLPRHNPTNGATQLSGGALMFYVSCTKFTSI